MALATLTDVGNRLGRDLTDSETRRATALLDDATDIICQAFPQYLTIPTRRATSVCAEMVARVLRNPNGLRSETIDDYSYTVDSALSAGELYMTENEEASLRPVRTSSFSITPGAPVIPDSAYPVGSCWPSIPYGEPWP